jgi:hypothetical protein
MPLFNKTDDQSPEEKSFIGALIELVKAAVEAVKRNN